MRFRNLWAATVASVLERGREKQTEPRVFGIPVAHVPGQSQPSRDGVSFEKLTGCSCCGRTPRPEESPTDDWQVGSGDSGALLVLCPECSERE